MTRGLRVAPRATLVAVLLLGGCALDRPTASTTESQQSHVGSGGQSTLPNIVVILVDDARFDLTTRPFLPKTYAHLADSGIVFRNGYANTPLCCPSRSTMFTGLYVHNHGVIDNSAPDGGAQAFNDTRTIATALHGAGYVTGLFGKYLNQYGSLQPFPYVPPGWDEWHGVLETNPYRYYNYRTVDRLLAAATTTVTWHGSAPSDHQTTTIEGLAIRFIGSVPANLPLAMFVTPFAPHQPATPAPSDLAACAGLPVLRPPSYNEAVVSDQPAFVRARKIPSARILAASDSLRLYMCRSLVGVDRMVEAIVQALGSSGRLSNSYLFFLSDNGDHFGEHRLFLRKATLFEESVHVPFIVRGPGLQPRVDAMHFVQIADVAPTLLQIAGIPNTLPVDGSSLFDVFSNPMAPGRDDVLLEMLDVSVPNETAVGIRTAQWAYHEYANGDRALYDMVNAPPQATNRAGQTAYAAIQAQLASRLAVLRTQ